MIRPPSSSQKPSKAPEPTPLDDRRSEAGRAATELRRHFVRDLRADQYARRRDQEEIEAHFMAKPATTWPAAVAEAQYLIRRYAETTDAKDSNRLKLIERVLGDLDRLLASETPAKTDAPSDGS